MESFRLFSRRRSQHGWAETLGKFTGTSRVSSVSLSTIGLRHPPPRSKKRRWKDSRRSRFDSRTWGEKIRTLLTHAPGNGAAIGGIKVIAENGWFGARPSGTENIYKIYAESFHGEDHLRRILDEAQTIVDEALKAATSRDKSAA